MLIRRVAFVMLIDIAIFCYFIIKEGKFDASFVPSSSRSHSVHPLVENRLKLCDGNERDGVALGAGLACVRPGKAGISHSDPGWWPRSASVSGMSRSSPVCHVLCKLPRSSLWIAGGPGVGGAGAFVCQAPLCAVCIVPSPAAGGPWAGVMEVKSSSVVAWQCHPESRLASDCPRFMSSPGARAMAALLGLP